MSKKDEIVKSVTKCLYSAKFNLQKYSPEILVAAGIVGGIATVILACKATRKSEPVVENTKEALDEVHDLQDPEYCEENDLPVPTKQEVGKETLRIYISAGADLAKIYAPVAAVGMLSIGCILTSHKILRERDLALASAYAALDTAFKSYRSRVAAKFGEDVETELRNNLETTEVEETIVDEKGKEKTVKKEIKVANGLEGYSEYAKFFDSGCPDWTKNAEYNLMTVKLAQQTANNMLQAHGYVFLNEVYDLLGIPRTKAGQVVGWIYDPDDPTHDNYVDFGIYDARRMANRDFVNGYEPVILLDFNVDGQIWDKVKLGDR